MDVRNNQYSLSSLTHKHSKAGGTAMDLVKLFGHKSSVIRYVYSLPLVWEISYLLKSDIQYSVIVDWITIFFCFCASFIASCI